MIKKVFYIILFLFTLLSTQQILLFSNMVGNRKIGESINHLLYNITPLFYNKIFNSELYYSGEYNKSNKVDIFMANHISSIDIFINFAMFVKNDTRKMYIILKNQILMYPIIGPHFTSTRDLKLHRKIDMDKENIEKFVNSVDNAVIFIYPEGTRKTQKKYEKSVKYCQENNLPVLNNLLFPKMRGIHLIISTLIKNNKMGNLIDGSYYVEKFKNKDLKPKQILFKNLGNTYYHIHTHNVPTNENMFDYDYFKSWFINIWKGKDMILENMDKFIYKRMDPFYDTSTYIILFVSLFTLFYLSYKTKGLYILLLILLNFIVSFIKK